MKNIDNKKLIEEIDGLLKSADIPKRQKTLFKIAKKQLLSSDSNQWIKGFELLGKILTGTNTFLAICKIIWDWLKDKI